MFFNFHFVDNHLIATFLTATEAKEKMNVYWETLLFYNFCVYSMTVKNNKISYQFLMTTKLFLVEKLDSTPSKSGSGLPIQIDAYFVLFKDVCY